MQLYFDETIREKGDFVIGALVASEIDLTPLVHRIWQDEGLDPRAYEFKSSSPKHTDEKSKKHRTQLARLLIDCRLALLVVPMCERKLLGNHCAALLAQLLKSKLIPHNANSLFVDQGILVSTDELDALGLKVYPEQNSISCGGLQVADHAAHVLGSMLLEDLGCLTKLVKISDEEGCCDETINLGFELWAGLRYSFFGITNPELDPYDQNTHTRMVDGYGLLVTSSCSPKLRKAAKRRFGSIYLGCIN